MSLTVFADETLSMLDGRQDYGEERIITVGKLTGKVIVIVWTQRRIKAPHYFDEVRQETRKTTI